VQTTSTAQLAPGASVRPEQPSFSSAKAAAPPPAIVSAPIATSPEPSLRKVKLRRGAALPASSRPKFPSPETSARSGSGTSSFVSGQGAAFFPAT
jgi:hypothetical protein